MSLAGREGGCFCGAVRYRLESAPFDAGWCHCRTCQRISGSSALAFATVPRAHFAIVRGEEAVGTISSSDVGQRRFCIRCGTPLTIEVTFQPDALGFTIASLDEPDAVPPGYHIFYTSRIGWAEAGDALPRHDGFRPDTRGL